MAARLDYRSLIPADADGQQRYCARGDWCAASTRDTEGAWHPALTWQPYCGTCTAKIVACLTELPALYGLLTAGPAGLAKATGRVRVPPGPRMHVSPAADSLAREAAAILGGWAARVRAVPGLSLSPPVHPFRSPARVREDCAAMALHDGPLMALTDGWTTRVYDLPEAAAPLNRASGTCRKCGRKVTRSPVSGWWWAHDGRPAGFCDHQPVRIAQAVPPPEPVPGGLGFRHHKEEDISDLEIVSIGDDWVKVMVHRNALHAGAEILGLDWHARRVTGQVPARPETLDGIPCRSCEAMSLTRTEQPPPDPRLPPPPVARCAECGDEMTRAEFTAWCVMYAAWVKGSGILTCRRCDLGAERGRAHECCWGSCTCCGGKRRRAA
jgi:hypothetical protein